MRTNVLTALSLALSLGAMACGSGTVDDDNQQGQDGGPVLGILLVIPAETTVAVVDGVANDVDYQVMLVKDDGSMTEVTDQVSMSLDNPDLGAFNQTSFVASGNAGGKAKISASMSGAQGTASLTVHVTHNRVVQPAPANIVDRFASASEDPALSPTVVYPEDTTMVPPNLGAFEVHFTGPSANDLYQISLKNAFVEVNVYLVAEAATGAWTALETSEWDLAAKSSRGSELLVETRGLDMDTSRAGTSAATNIAVTDGNIKGAIYYWASIGSQPPGIYRHDMANAGEPAELYINGIQTEFNCVGCHALSRDGTKMALTYEVNAGNAGILDVATKTPILSNNNNRWNFAAFDPTAERVISIHGGAMALRDVNNGAVITTVAQPEQVSQPDFSPLGDAIVYVAMQGFDLDFENGSILTRSFDPATETFGNAQVLVGATPNQNNYYPSYSPDGEWIIFTRSSERSYDARTAEIWVVKADGSSAPVRLDVLNDGADITNSWGRWAPFEQIWGGDIEEEPFFWVTFSSKRDFGVRLRNNTLPQLWMAPFFPQRAGSGQDPTLPAFRLPFQAIDTNNHIGQWAEELVTID